MAIATTDPNVLRNSVINGLHEPIGEIVRTIDQVEVAVRVHLADHGIGALPIDLRNVLARLVRARDAYLKPLVERASEDEG